MQESQNIEYKEIWKEEYLKWVAGFANASGGKIYIGINDSGEIIGVQNVKKLLEDIPNKIVNALGIIPEVNILEKNNIQYLEIYIAPSSVPISYKGSYFLRSGSTKQELKGNTLQQFLLKRLGKSWDDLPCEYATLNDIDNSAIEYFFQKALLSNRISKFAETDDLLTILENLNLITEGSKLKNAAILLFGKQPAKFFPGTTFKIGRFVSNDDDLKYQDIVEGNILEMADKVLNILKTKYLISPIRYEGLQRIESLEIPEDALREAIFNAIVHKDYTGAPIQLSVYNDKLILWNEGRLPNGFTIQTLLKKHPSRPHNKTIAELFFKAGFIEAWGRGISKIMNEFKDANLPVPVFETNMGGIVVNIQRNNTKNFDEGVNEGVSEGVKQLLDIIRSSPGNRTPFFADTISTSPKNIERWIQILKKEGKIEFRGSSKKGGYYSVISNKQITDY